MSDSSSDSDNVNVPTMSDWQVEPTFLSKSNNIAQTLQLELIRSRNMYNKKVRQLNREYSLIMEAVNPASSELTSTGIETTAGASSQPTSTAVSTTAGVSTSELVLAPPIATSEQTIDEPIDNTVSDDLKIWPDGNITYTVPKEGQIKQGIPYLGYTFCQTTKHKGVRKYYCLGVFACTHEGCEFVQRPAMPTKNKGTFASPPPPAKYTCPLHADDALAWKKCVGGPADIWPRSELKDGEVPCTIITRFDHNTDEVQVQHYGTHSHPRPPVKKVNPKAMVLFGKFIDTHPNIGPAKLRAEIDGRASVREIDPALGNQGRVKYLRNKHKSKSTEGKPGGLGAFIQLSREIKEKFIRNFEVADKERQAITMQSEYMEQVLNEADEIVLESDTVMNCIYDIEFSDHAELHITSMFDRVIGRWVPVLISILFGMTKEHYVTHWQSLFNSLGEEIVASWETFQDRFGGVTVDWSDALGISFIDTLISFAEKKWDLILRRKHVVSFLRKCDVHFLRSLRRIEQNGNVVPVQQQRDFRLEINKLLSNKTKFDEFARVIKKLDKNFPKANPWLRWYLNPDRARSFFQACQDFTDAENERFGKLQNDTNAQENLGKNFEYTYLENNTKKVSLVECIRDCYKWQNVFAADRLAVMKGLDSKYAQLPRVVPGPKRPKITNDGRAPDSNTKLKLKKNKRDKTLVSQVSWGPFTRAQLQSWYHPKSLSHQIELEMKYQNACGGLFIGPKWNIAKTAFNTCPLDSFMNAIYMPYRAGQLHSPYPDLSNPGSLLSRSFACLDQGKTEEARVLWMKEIHGLNFDGRTSEVNLFGATDFYFCNTYLPKNIKIHPLTELFKVRWTTVTRCRHEGGCKMGSDKNKLIPLTENDDVPGEDIPQTSRRKARKQLPWYDGDDSPAVTFNAILGERAEGVCSSKGGEVHCPGPKFREDAHDIEWPHTVIIRFGEGNNRKMSEVPDTFEYHDKKFIFRSATLGEGIHFTSINKHINGYLHYDGMDKLPRYRDYALEDADSAMRGRDLDLLFYEVVPTTTEEIEGDLGGKRDFRDHFLIRDYTAGSNNHDDDGNEHDNTSVNLGDSSDSSSIPETPFKSKKSKELVNLDDSSDSSSIPETPFKSNKSKELVSLSQELFSSHKKRKKKKNTPVKEERRVKPKETTPVKAVRAKKKAKSVHETPIGISFVSKVKRSGKRPACKGCKQEINYDTPRIRHKHKGTWWAVDQYHCNAECLKENMEDGVLSELMKKQWNEPTMTKVVKELKKLIDFI